MDVMATNNSNSTTTGAITATIGGLSLVPPSELRSVPFTNGVLKRHKQHHVLVGGGGGGGGGVVYKECLKNHAASMGGHALDGCGEFMPAQTATATDPTSLKCAACGCHRNFHRVEKTVGGGGGVGVGGAGMTHMIEYHPQHRHHPLPPPVLGASPIHAVAACQVQSPGSDNNSPPPISSTYYPGSAPHMLLALSSGGGTDTPNVDTPTKLINTPTTITTNTMMTNNSSHEQQTTIFTSISPHLSSRKRFRTKFSQDQKERMQDFAEKLGWKMQKSTDELVKGFCNEIGVQREVFKVWMHNNKNTLVKRSDANYVISANNEGGISTNPMDLEDINNGNSHSSSINNSINLHHQPFNNNNNNNNNGKSYQSNAATSNASSSSS